MKKIIRYSFVILTFFSFSTFAQDLSGQWRWASGDGQKVFTIDLAHITKDRVQGVHCVEDFEIKISECFQLQDEYTIHLVKISENIFQGNLMSGEGRNRLVEDIQLQYIPLDDNMIFSHTKSPKGISLIPLEGVLRR